MTFRSRFVTFACAVAAVLGVYACSTGTTTGITPITGIVVRADTLVAGHGCGTGPDQIYEYAAVVSELEAPDGGVAPDGAPGPGALPTFVAAGAYNCFADATFVNLCASSTGSYTYEVNVYAFTYDQWNAQQAAMGADLASVTLSPPGADLPEVLANAPSFCTDGGVTVQSGIQNEVTTTLAAGASFTATCTATQQSNIEVLAVCGPLEAP